MIIDRDWLTEQGACSEGKEFFLKEGITDPVLGIKNLLNKDRLSWANWLLVRVLPQQQRVQYACYAAKQVLKYFEKARPKDKRPRKAIEAALKLVKYPTAANRSAARSAASAARSAASAASAAWSAAESAESAAWSAWYAARSAWYAARSAAESAARSAAESAARSAASAAESAARSAASAAMRRKIIKYGLSLFVKSNKAICSTSK